MICRLAIVVFVCAPFFAGGAQANAQPHYDPVEQQIFAAWETAFPGEGALAVQIARCEGWNDTAGFDVGHVSGSGDVGPFQINQIHDDDEFGALRVLFGDDTRWPGPAASLSGNITVALFLREQNGFSDWNNSRHCWSSAIGSTLQNQQEPRPIPRFTG